MAPRESIKATPKVQRTVSKTKVKASPIATIKKSMVTRKLVQATPIQVSRTAVKSKPVVPSTPKPKDNKPLPVPNSTTKSGKKHRKPKNAHSGVPVPSKLLKLMGKQLQAAGTL